MSYRSLTLLACLIAVPAAGCNSLWSALLSADPRNCAGNPGACLQGEVCDPQTEACVPGPAAGMDMAMAVGLSPDLAAQLAPSLCSGTLAAVPRTPSCGTANWATPGGPIAAFSGTSLPLGLSASSFALADFNRDGMLDIAVCDDQFRVLLYQGVKTAGRYGTLEPTIIPLASHCNGLAPGDFNEDGYPDLATADFGLQSVSIQLGAPGLTINPQALGPFGTSSTPQSLLPAYLNCDSKLDLVVVTSPPDNLVTLRNLGDATFGTVTPVSGAGRTYQPDVGDMNQDGVADLIADQTGAVKLAYEDSTARYTFAQTVAAIGNTLAVVSGDFDGDGRPDFAAASGTQVTLYLQQPNRTFLAAGSLSLGANVLHLAADDLNGDKLPDLVAVLASGEARVLRNINKGQGLTATSLLSGNVRSIALGDLNCDGKPDVTLFDGQVLTFLMNSAP